MSFAVVSNLRFNTGWAKEFGLLRSGTFIQFDNLDQMILSDWLERAAARGIDSAFDLTTRPWRVTGLDAAFGVFETNRKQVSWLIVRHGSDWTLARCADGFVSDVSSSLIEVLGLIDDELLGFAKSR